jgi:ribosomal protein L40E
MSRARPGISSRLAVRPRETEERREKGVQLECASCNAELPADAHYCSKCGSSQNGDHELWDECAITWWRGYTTGEFVAVRFGSGTVEEIARSPSFRWLGGRAAPPERPRVASCLDNLFKQLTDLGWVRSESGGQWYDYRFRRRLIPPPGTGMEERRRLAESRRTEVSPRTSSNRRKE